MKEALSGPKQISVAEGKLGVDASWKAMYRIGGLAMMVAGLLYLVGSTLGYSLGVPPGNSEAYLDSLRSKLALAHITYVLFAVADVVLFPAILSLYLALKDVKKSAMLIGAALSFSFILLDLGITESNTLSILSLIQNSTAAENAAQQAMYLAAEHWGLATLPLATFFSWIGPSLGFLIISIVMFRSFFGRYTALLGIAANGLGIIGAFYFLHPIPFIALLLTPILIIYGIWFVATGRRLFGLTV